jgi:hypothetical protein
MLSAIERQRICRDLREHHKVKSLVCPVCHAAFESAGTRAKFCSDRCRYNFHAKKRSLEVASARGTTWLGLLRRHLSEPVIIMAERDCDGAVWVRLPLDLLKGNHEQDNRREAGQEPAPTPTGR